MVGYKWLFDDYILVAFFLYLLFFVDAALNFYAVSLKEMYHSRAYVFLEYLILMVLTLFFIYYVVIWSFDKAEGSSTR